ncbi:MAG: protein kinase [Chthoniobacterales bacterium]|nr:protein kinase [Chthoniobacterales bacterium]
MSCLLAAGLTETEEFATSHEDLDSLGIYTLLRREDGTRWELGRGSMGVTYLARDPSLQREVALKIIDAEIFGSGGEARARFLREARATAVLRHPNVATVYQYGVDEESGKSYYAMELVEGETLQDRVRRSGTLDLPTVIEIARQITAALGAAEKRGLVHRDLKPSNVMLTTGEEGGKFTVKVIDFGLAKALAETPDARALTQGDFVGTPAFASPEQLAGAPVDVRADLYSLGATLWYLLTGHMPFGDRAGVLPPVEQLKAAGVPANVTALLVSLVALEPAARPSIPQLEQRLAVSQERLIASRKLPLSWMLAAAAIALAAGAAIIVSHPAPGWHGPRGQKGIAVLPFTDRSEEKANAFFTDGIHDDLLVNLSKIADLKVISRDSVLPYKNGARDRRQIGKDLGVNAVLEGSVRHMGNRARINVQLIDTTNDQQMWAQNYDRQMTDAFTIQSDLAFEIASALKAKLTPGENARLREHATENGEAYLFYIQANDLFADYEKRKPDLERAEQLYEKAIQIDPHFALALAQLSQVQMLLHEMYDPVPARLERAKSLVEEAVRLRPDLPEVHIALGRYYGHGEGWRTGIDYARAMSEYEIALRGLPNNADIYNAMAKIERHLGHWELSATHVRQAATLNPNTPEAWHRLFFSYELMRNFPAAAEALDRAIAVSPNSWNFELHRAWLQVFWKGDIRELERVRAPVGRSPEDFYTEERFSLKMFLSKFAEAEKILRDDPNDLFGLYQLPKSFLLGQAYLGEGDLAKARENFEAARPWMEERVEAVPNEEGMRFFLADLYLGLGRKADAVREGKEAIVRNPEAKDAWNGQFALTDLARLYAKLGDADSAIPVIEHLLSEPSTLCQQNLRLDPSWNPIRGDARFQKLAEQPDRVFGLPDKVAAR